ncbi:Secreted frizzled- protein 5 [Homalodisca vitripennis]|nr:Secreted frizzled- protein 5 [Homalodisca vitripennis]
MSKSCLRETTRQSILTIGVVDREDRIVAECPECWWGASTDCRGVGGERQAVCVSPGREMPPPPTLLSVLCVCVCVCVSVCCATATATLTGSLGLAYYRAPQQHTCVDIPRNLSLCREIGYDKMRLPNLLEHDTVLEATQQAVSWVPLQNVHCDADTQLFLCSLFSPVCLDHPIYPCRSLCEKVRRGCEGRMRTYGFPWPEMFHCDKFPVDNDMCIASRTRTETPPPPGRSLAIICRRGVWARTFNAIHILHLLFWYTCRTKHRTQIAILLFEKFILERTKANRTHYLFICFEQIPSHDISMPNQ